MSTDAGSAADQFVIGIVGPCSSGKSTLARYCRGAGYAVKEILQEHSAAPAMWQQITNPDILIYLDVSVEVAARREGLTVPSSWWAEERDVRLIHARAHCNFYIDTSDLSTDEVAARVTAYLQSFTGQSATILSQESWGMTKQTEQVRLSAEQRASQLPKMLPSSGSGGLPDASAEPASGAMGKPPPVVAFVGLSGSGKTTLLLKLIPVLRARQIRVAMVKHSSHRGVETDIAGSDSRRFWDAGAHEVALVTPDRVALTRRVESEPRLDEVLSVVGSADLVLLEGFKCSDVSKIEVIRAACTSALLEGLRGRVACVTDVADLAIDCPVFGLNDVEGVADFLIERVAGLA